MRIFVGYGYNDRDAWIEQTLLPILKAMTIETVDGKDMHGEVLQDGVKDRIEQSNALIGFCTLREGQQGAAFNTHPWVRDEMVHASALGKPVVEVREAGVNNVEGLLGNRQRIILDQNDRLACVTELVQVVSDWSMRRLLLVPREQKNARKLRQALVRKSLIVRYRSRVRGVDSNYRSGRIELVDNGYYLNAIGLPSNSLVEVEGSTADEGVIFNTGWASADLVRIEF